MPKPNASPPPIPAPDPERFTRRIAELRGALQGANPLALAQRTGSAYRPLDGGQGRFDFALWREPVWMAYPRWVLFQGKSGQPMADIFQALALYYFTTADGALPSGEWISFTDLPDGRFYTQAFQSYTGQPLAQAFGGDLAAFRLAASKVGGQEYPLGDAAFVFQALPRVSLLAVYWLGDEDFPASAQVLFDANASRWLPTDAYAILGSTLARRLIAARPTDL